MTLGDVATKARMLTNTDISSYPDAQLLIDLNIWYQKIVSMIFESQDDSNFDDQRATNYPVQTTPMVASQRDYTMPVSERVMKIKRVDVTYDGVNWYRAEPFDTGTYDDGIGFTNSSSSDPAFDASFVKEAPRYDVAYNAVWLSPMPTAADVAAGGLIRVEWDRAVTPFTSADYTSVITDSTMVPGFDLPFHGMLSHGAAYEYAISRQLPQLEQIGTGLQDWEMRLRQAYGRKDLDKRLFMGAGYDDTFGR